MKSTFTKIILSCGVLLCSEKLFAQAIEGTSVNVKDAWDGVYTTSYGNKKYNLIGTYQGWDPEAIYFAGYNATNSSNNPTKRIFFGGGSVGQGFTYDIVNQSLGLGTANPSTTLDISGNQTIRNMQNAPGGGASIHFTSFAPTDKGPRIRSYLDFAQSDNSVSRLILSSYNAKYEDELTLSAGKVGVGNLNPQSKLDVNGNIQISNSNIPMGLITEVGGNTPLLNMSLNFRESNKNNTYLGAAFRIDGRADANSHLFQWIGRPAGSAQETVMMGLTASGKLGIGTSTPDEKLTVNGVAHAREVRVDANILPPDYVFKKDYDLMPLSEVEDYIKLNSHLPEIPSAKEMEKDGIKLSAISMLLLKKVEELTLYLLKNENQLRRQEQINSELNERLKSLETNSK